MDEMRLDGRTAIVTGAGGNPGLGRAHALLLASRGANVVVNDIGRDRDAPGYADSACADAVVEEIRALGGRAVADTHTVTSEAGAQAITQAAIDAFGRVDILVNNAGVIIPAQFDEITPQDFEKHLEVNIMGSVLASRAVWPFMQQRGYGRIVNTCSSSFSGFKLQSAYGTSKGGVFSLTRALAVEGAPHGIKVNSINPGAYTRMVTATLEDDSEVSQNARKYMPPELVSPVVAFLAHEDCPVTGECIEVVGGMVRRIYLSQTEGFTDAGLTVEALASRWGEVMDTASTIIGLGETDLSASTKPYRPNR